MEKKLTSLEGCFIIEPGIFTDERGSFLEHYNERRFNEVLGRNIEFVQDNLSVSAKGVLRGLHYQKGIYSQAKLVQVLKGRVQDVVVDLRKDSQTFGKSFSMILDDISRQQLFIPKGFAHGFLALTDDVLFSYKCDAYYAPGQESGIRFDDPVLNIEWALTEDQMILSGKDRVLRLFHELEEAGEFNW